MPHFTQLIDLASVRLGGVALATNDEFFAEKENLLKPTPAVFLPHEYTDRGKWMDGWESRRKRGPGHDWCVVKLGLPGIVRGVDVDTSHFKGNYPDGCSIDACVFEGAKADATPPDSAWREILPRTGLLGDTHNLLTIFDTGRWTHVRLNIYPDGGVARLRVHGEVAPDWLRLAASKELVDLAALEHGGATLLSSNMFFGAHTNLIMPGRAANMSDGWETQRRRGPGHDWVILRLGARGAIRKVEVDTNHFKGNFPDRCSLEVTDAEGASLEQLTDAKQPWATLLAETKLAAHTRHFFDKELAADATATPVTHARLRVYPDGGVSRLRLLGRPV